MKYLATIFLIVFSLCTYGDGVYYMQLESVVPLAELIMEVEIIDNKVTEEMHKHKGEVVSTSTTCDIKLKVISIIYGQPDKEEMEIRHTVSVVDGVVEANPGSGLESKFKKGEKCIALLGQGSWLFRLEKQENKETVIRFLTNSVLAQDESLLTYRWQGGYSPYKQVEVKISQAGAAMVTGQKQDSLPLQHLTSFSNEELETLRELIRSTGFFTQTGQDTDLDTGEGKTELTIHLDGKSKTLNYLHLPALEPLEHFAWRLITQASAIQALESDGDVSSAANAVMPTHAGMKSLQPGRLKIPLMSYVRDHYDRQKIETALEALSWVTTPEEYSRFVSLGLKKGDLGEKLLGIIGTHPFCGNIPGTHLKSLCPVFLAYAKDAHSRKSELGAVEQKALADFTRLLGEARYEPAIPLLKDRFEKHDRPYITTSLTPLAKMGLPGLRALTPYLESKKEAHRLNAIELLTIASRLGPNGGFANPLSEQEFRRMIPVFTDQVIPRLRDLSGEDPSNRVKKKAGEALKEIIGRIEKEKNTTGN